MIERLRPVHGLLLGLALATIGVVGTSGCGGAGNAAENVFNYYEPSNLKGLDPMMASTMYSHRAVSEMYEGLLQYSYLKRPYQVEPQLAVTMPDISDDGLTYTFKIKKGVKFHDNPCFKATGGKGRELTAEDFIYSWKRIADVKNVSEGWWIFEGKIVGLDEFRDYSKGVDTGAGQKVDYARPVEGIQAPDPYTLVVKLKVPYPQFQYVLTMGYTKAVPREAVDFYGKEFLNNPVGTGPFVLKSWVKGSKLIYERNPEWRTETYPTEGEEEDKTNGMLADAGKKVPFVDKIVVHIMIEDQPRWLKFMRGDIDVIAPPKDNYDSAMPGGKLTAEMIQMGIQNVKLPRLDVVYTSFNMTDPVLGHLTPKAAHLDKDLREVHERAAKERAEKYPHITNEKALAIRQALSLAYDRQKMAELFYNDRALLAKGPIPPGLPGYDAEFDNPWTKYDPEKAKKILADAGFPDGKGIPSLQYETSSGTTSMQMAQFRKQLYKAIGVDMDINTNTWPELDNKVKTMRAQFFGMAWQADYPDAQNFLQLFYGPFHSPSPNGSNYSDPSFDALYEKAKVMFPGPERTELYRKMERIVTEAVPWSFDAHRLVDTLTHGWLKNYKPHDVGHGNWKYYRIDTEMRGKLKPTLR